MLAFKNLETKYPSFMLGPVTLELGSGVNILVGPNGSGKSTLLGCIAGTVTPTSGDAAIAGLPLKSNRTEALRHFSLVPDSSEYVFQHIKPLDYWALVAAIRHEQYGEDRAELLDRARHFAELLRVPEEVRSFSEYSLGNRRKIQIVAGLMPKTDCVVLDEPQSGLDYVSSRALQESLVAEAESGRTFFLSSHDLDSVAQCASRIIALKDGQVADDIEKSAHSHADLLARLDRVFNS